jgi:hypothetical protein
MTNSGNQPQEKVAPAQPAVPRRMLTVVAQALIALTLVLGLMQYATEGRVAYTMDSLTYRDAALHFMAGHPMQSSNVMAEAPEREPLLVWPPAYPALWATVASLGNISIDDAPTVLNPALLAFTTLIVFWVCWMVTGSPAVACLVATASGFVPTSMIVFGHAWSETIFIPLVLLGYAAFWKYRTSRENLFWLASAAIFVGLANWIRYAGVAFIPILAFSVLVASSSSLGKRILHVIGAMLVCVALALPLWLRNWNLSGNISGSTRGGLAHSDRLALDMATIVDSFEHCFFAFSMVLRANLEIPIIVAITFLIFKAFRRHGVQWLHPPEIWLPLVWLSGYLAFLLYARTMQSGVPMDLRMLAVAFPFLLFALTPAVNAAFSERLLDVKTVLISLLLGLLINSGVHEALRTHKNYASADVPRWRSVFGLAFRDMRNTSPTSRALLESIGPIDPSALVMTDYRALYIRYLTGARAFSPYAEECPRWANGHADAVLLVGATEPPAWSINCMEIHPKWKLLRPTGRAAPSMYSD